MWAGYAEIVVMAMVTAKKQNDFMVKAVLENEKVTELRF